MKYKGRRGGGTELYHCNKETRVRDENHARSCSVSPSFDVMNDILKIFYSYKYLMQTCYCENFLW